VQFSSPKYHYSIAMKIATCCLCIFLSIIVHAQDYPDTLVATEQPPVEEVKDDSVAEVQEETPKYFKNRNDIDAGIAPANIRRIPNDKLRSFRNDPDFWYADSSFKKGEELAYSGGNQVERSDSLRELENKALEEKKAKRKSTFNTVLWLVVIAGFLTFLVLFLGNSNVRIFRKTQRLDDDTLEEENTEDIFAINYQREIDKAATNRNYRLAIRLMFLRMLKDLSQKNIIQYRPDRTNLDYLMQVHSSIYYNEFFRITRNYEYAWYGKVDITEQAYAQVKNEFETFHPIKTS
jgi:hypothetical protein